MTDLERIKEKYKKENNNDINTLIELLDQLYVTLGEVSVSFTEKVQKYEKALKDIAENDEDSSCNELALKYEVIAEQALA